MTQAERDEMLIRLDVGINGNGGKGLHSRIDDIEEWKEKRPVGCPAQIKQKNILARRAVDAAVIGTVIGFLLWVLDRFIL